MEISEYIYEGFVKPYYKKPTTEDTNRADHRRKMRGEYASSNNYSNMSESSENHIKIYVDNLRDIPKHTCLIHGPGNQ